MRAVLIDAGPLVSLFDQADPHHRRYLALLSPDNEPLRLHTTWPCVVEASHFLRTIPRLELLRWVALGGAQVFPFDAPALMDMTQWMLRYTEEPRSEMDFADASLYWLAHESGITRILTLDQRDFSRYRLPDGRAFEII